MAATCRADAASVLRRRQGLALLASMALLQLSESRAWAQSPPFGTFQGLGFISGGYPEYDMVAVSANGSVAIGYNRTSYCRFCRLVHGQAFRWTAVDGMQGLGFINGGGPRPDSSATGLSADGSVVVGRSTYSNAPSSTFFPNEQAFRWTTATGMQGLGFINGGG